MVLLSGAIAPGLFWLWYFVRRDHLRPEPQFLVRRMFLLGILAGFGAAAAEFLAFRTLALELTPGSLGAAALAATVVGVVEEGLKFAAVFFGVYRHVAFDEIFDGIVYSVSVSMGFATLENIAYVLSGGLQVGLVRAVLSVPGHAFFATLVGYRMGMAKLAPGREGETRWLLGGLGLAIAAHALYDAVLFTQTILGVAVIPLVGYLWRRAVVHSRTALTLDGLRFSPPGETEPVPPP